MLVGAQGAWSPSPAGVRGEIPGGFLGLNPSLPGSFGTRVTTLQSWSSGGHGEGNANHPPAKPGFVSGTGGAGGACGWLPLPSTCERTCLCVSVPARAGCSSCSTHRLLQGSRPGRVKRVPPSCGVGWGDGHDAAHPRDHGGGCSASSRDPCPREGMEKLERRVQRQAGLGTARKASCEEARRALQPAQGCRGPAEGPPGKSHPGYCNILQRPRQQPFGK